ncbi:hypothetical protein Tco_0663180 [Tanacetum coccineum]
MLPATWMIRPDGHTLNSMNIINHGGTLTSPPNVRYRGGKANWFDDVDADSFSAIEVQTMVKDLGYDNKDLQFYYKIPNSNLDIGLKPLSCDKDVMEMCNYVSKFSGSNTGKTPMVIEEIDRTDSSVASEDRIEDARASEDSDDSDFDVGEEDRIEDVDVDMADFRKHTNGNVEWVEYDNECERKKALKKLAKTHKPVDGQMYTENFYVGQTLANKQLIKGMCRGLVPVFGNGPSDSGLGDSGPVCDKPKLDSGSNKKTKKKGQVEDSNKCPWLLHCSKSKNAKTWWVKKTDDNHTCLQSRTVRKCTASFLSKEVEETIKPDPKVPISALKDQLQRKYELGMPDMKVFRAKQMAEERVIGD